MIAVPLATAASQLKDPQAAVAELARKLDDSLGGRQRLGGVLFFCSADYPLPALGQALADAFGEVAVSGCTTAGEITPEGYARGSITAIGLARSDFALAQVLIDDLSGFDLPRAQTLSDELLARCREQAVAPVMGNSFALTLLDGLSSSEEQVLATLDAALGSIIPAFGGSAGDDNRLAHTYVYADGVFHDQAAVVVVINTRLPFEVISTHHLTPLADKLVVTAVDRDSRRVLELNAEPAAEEYARLAGVAPEALEEAVFARCPLAVRIGEAHYVRSIQRVNADASLSFYCAVETGIVLTAMQATPILAQLEQRLAEVEARLGPPALTIGCDCFLRRMEIEALGLEAEASRLLRHHRVIGFNTYGEQHHGMHINQTFTGVVIGQRRLAADGTGGQDGA
ncbi:nitric oxide-sensing protein NosP [Cobetia sp. 3AK]|uniref:nitric oxide-sensing protein NosP n=1 Tax=Cobetia sp. 3AK TaxID=3040020 RepID=UPI0024487506|nr:nitric oxide-sensing protein NosP [Cobetia sp. 3AK]MDH2373218.1 nitric oxide-sensing protein NosP [Cobetia sp. 3AK]